MPFGATLTQMTIRFHSVESCLVELDSQRKNYGGNSSCILCKYFKPKRKYKNIKPTKNHKNQKIENTKNTFQDMSSENR